MKFLLFDYEGASAAVVSTRGAAAPPTRGAAGATGPLAVATDCSPRLSALKQRKLIQVCTFRFSTFRGVGVLCRSHDAQTPIRATYTLQNETTT